MFENMICDGFSGTLGERYIKANNKYLPEYNEIKKSNYVIYYVENNLYGWSTSQSLPIGNFKMEKRRLLQIG